MAADRAERLIYSAGGWLPAPSTQITQTDELARSASPILESPTRRLCQTRPVGGVRTPHPAYLTDTARPYYARVAYNEVLADRVRAALADRTDVEEKEHVWWTVIHVGGQMCCGVLKDDLVVRIDPADFDQLVAQPHVRPFDFSGRPIVAQFHEPKRDAAHTTPRG